MILPTDPATDRPIPDPPDQRPVYSPVYPRLVPGCPSGRLPPVGTGGNAMLKRSPTAARATTDGPPAPDRRTQRKVARSEQERLTADADLDRRNRAALLNLELRERRAEAERRRRKADQREKTSRREARKARRDGRRARLRTAIPVWADRALFIGPIVFPMAVAWVGQIQFARDVMGWPLAGAVVFAAGFELSTAYVARLDWLARAGGDNTALFRIATWLFAAGAAVMNYWHAADPGFHPNGEAVSYSTMSITGVILWELLSIYRHRGILRAEGKLPPRRPRFGAARRIWFPRVTHLATLLVVRDGHTTTEDAWNAALAQVAEHGTVRNAIAVLRGKKLTTTTPEKIAAVAGADETARPQTPAKDGVETRLDKRPGRVRTMINRLVRRDDTTPEATPSDETPSIETRQTRRTTPTKTESSRQPETESRRDETGETASRPEKPTQEDLAETSETPPTETVSTETTGTGRRIGRRSSRRNRRDSAPGETKKQMIAYARERITAGETSPARTSIAPSGPPTTEPAYCAKAVSSAADHHCYRCASWPRLPGQEAQPSRPPR